jgi:hypothetical protein
MFVGVRARPTQVTQNSRRHMRYTGRRPQMALSAREPHRMGEMPCRIMYTVTVTLIDSIGTLNAWRGRQLVLLNLEGTRRGAPRRARGWRESRYWR